MLNLYDYLTEDDKRKIDTYVRAYGSDNYIGNEQWLSYWRDNKKRLFHLLGGKLIYEVPFTFEKDEEILKKEIQNLCSEDKFVYHFWDYIEGADKESVDKYGKLDNDNMDWDTKRVCHNITNSSTLLKNKINTTIKYQGPNQKRILQLQEGMKPIKAIQKLLNYGQPTQKLKDLFEEFRIKHSLIFNEKIIKATLCISIHPLDFLTMSDNNNKWSSCMSWIQDGCYHLGTVEMMNSNNVVCAYLKSNDNFTFKNENWGNKRWRQLFYCTDEIICSGKAYPYKNDDITKKILEILREFAKTNLNHEYTYGIEPYRDMIHIGSLYRMENHRSWIEGGLTKKHNIIFDSKAMYNDMFNDHSYTYWCVRNKVKKNTIISYSGKAPCVCCMKPVAKMHYVSPYDEDSYNSRYQESGEVMCKDCRKAYKCFWCGESSTTKLNKTKSGKYLCNNCLSHYTTCPECGEVYKSDLYDLSYNRQFYIKLTDEDMTYKDILEYSASKYRNEEFTDANAKFLRVDVCPTCQHCLELVEDSKANKNSLYERFDFVKITLKRDKTFKAMPWIENSLYPHISRKSYSLDDPQVKRFLPSSRRIPEASEVDI